MGPPTGFLQLAEEPFPKFQAGALRHPPAPAGGDGGHPLLGGKGQLPQLVLNPGLQVPCRGLPGLGELLPGPDHQGLGLF